jgi:hypothetical protein
MHLDRRSGLLCFVDPLFYVSGGFDHEVRENCRFGRCGSGCFDAGSVPGLSSPLPSSLL